jgi:hypothetical protein
VLCCAILCLTRFVLAMSGPARLVQSRQSGKLYLDNMTVSLSLQWSYTGVDRPRNIRLGQ